MSSITILHIISSSNIGGSPKHTLILCKELEKLGHRTILAFPSGGSFESSFRQSGITCYNIPSKSIFNPALHKYISSIIQKENVDIIHTHELRADMQGYISGLKTNKPVISTIHNMITHNRLSAFKKPVYYAISRKIYNSIFKTVAVSEAVKNNLILKLKVHSEKVITIYNGTEIIDLNRLENPEKTRSIYKIPQDTPILVCIGRLIPIQKGQEYLIKALPQVLQKHPNTRLLLVGDGSNRQSLEQLSMSLGLEKNITFTGWQHNIHDILNASDISVVPSLWDPLPRIVLESMMVGKPVVGSSVDGIKEVVVHEETGLLAPPQNSGELAKAIIRLLDNPGLLKELGKKGRNRVLEQFTAERHAKETLELYQTCIEES